MAGEKKLSQRDETLIKVLDRLSDSIGEQDLLLQELSKRQLELSADMERISELLHMQYDISDSALEKTQDTFNRYRSDMLSLVNEQDRMNEILKDLNKRHTSVAFSQDNIINMLTNLGTQLDTQDKLVRETNTYSARHGETLTHLVKQLDTQDKITREINTYSIKHEAALTKEISDMSRNVAKLHMDSEKRMGDEHKDTNRRLKEMKMDIERRLLELDKIEATLNVLLIRTEPPEKKANIFVRIYRRLRSRYDKIQLRKKR